MRRRRIAFMLRAMVMAVPSTITTCGDQTRSPEAVHATPPAVEGAARTAAQPTGGTASKGGQNLRPTGKIATGASEREGVASPLRAGAKQTEPRH